MAEPAKPQVLRWKQRERRRCNTPSRRGFPAAAEDRRKILHALGCKRSHGGRADRQRLPAGPGFSRKDFSSTRAMSSSARTLPTSRHSPPSGPMVPASPRRHRRRGNAPGRSGEKARCGKTGTVHLCHSDFQNPTGRSWSLERRKALTDLADRFGVPVVEDNPSVNSASRESSSLPSVRWAIRISRSASEPSRRFSPPACGWPGSSRLPPFWNRSSSPSRRRISSPRPSAKCRSTPTWSGSTSTPRSPEFGRSTGPGETAWPRRSGKLWATPSPFLSPGRTFSLAPSHRGNRHQGASRGEHRPKSGLRSR